MIAAWMNLLRGPYAAWARSAALALLLLLPAIVAYFAFPKPELGLASGSAIATSQAPASPETADENAAEDELPAATPRPQPMDDPEPGQPVSGSVVDGEGRPVSGAIVTCEDRPNMATSSDAQGRFELPAEAAGCKATASGPEFDPLPAVVLRSGSKNRLEVGSPGSISGVVVDELGKPLSAFSVGIESFTTPNGDRGRFQMGRQSFQDPMGAFELTGLAPGRYVLVATANQRPPTQSAAITVEPSRKTSGVTLTVGAGGTASGIVTDRETKQPISGVRVTLDGVSSAMGGQSASTDQQGKYSLVGIPSGAFSLRFSHGQYRERIEPLDARGQATLSSNVDLAERGDGPSSEWTGIGATLSAGGSYVSIAGVFEGGPADTAGVKSGDQIESIEGDDMKGGTVADCVTRLRGPQGTRVRMTVKRGSDSVSFNITRAQITR